jgi:XTP/dITP diphosphohydrolase
MSFQHQQDAFGRLLTIMDDLRAKCPWDMKQTMESLRTLTIEEVYELSDAILKKDTKEIKEELGDLMLHLVFYAKIASETQDFDIADALHSVCDKLIHRHPHIYGDTVVNGEEDVKKNWEQLKLREGKKSVLSGVPDSLPSMIKAYRMQDKTAQVGFEWDNIDDVWSKLQEEIEELKEAKEIGDVDRVEEEFGDVLFSMINYARYIGVNPDTALERVNQKFKARFQYIEAHANKSLTDMTLQEMDHLWDEAKVKLKK